MQPCAVCGGIGVDASGYCVNCRTYRGVTAQITQPGPGQGGSPRPSGANPYPPTTTYPPRSPSGAYQIYTEHSEDHPGPPGPGYPDQRGQSYPDQQRRGYPDQHGQGYPDQQSQGYADQQGQGYPERQGMPRPGPYQSGEPYPGEPYPGDRYPGDRYPGSEPRRDAGPYPTSDPVPPREPYPDARSRSTGSHRTVPPRSTSGAHALVPRSTTGSHALVPSQARGTGGRPPTGPADRQARDAAALPAPGPAAPERQAPRQRRGPLLAIVGVIGVLAVAGGAVYALRDDPAPSATMDECLVGSWTVTTMNLDLATENLGTVHFTSTGDVGRVSYAADGATVYDYGDNSQFTAAVVDGTGSRKVTLKVTGTVRYTVQTSKSTLRFSNVQATGKSTITVAGSTSSSTTDITVNTDPAKYSCQGDTLTTYTETYRSEAHRAG